MTQAFEELGELQWELDDLAYHQLRVLLLVTSVAEEPAHNRKLDGLTKLAKLDFFVRYPALATVVLDELGPDGRMHLTEEDLLSPTTVQDPMTRYKYGPWDDRYYPVIGALVARDLLKYGTGQRGSVSLLPTPAGKALAADLAEDAIWRDLADRCAAVAEASRGMTGNALKELIYERLADLMDRPHRQVIT